jgi:hypothetical protein
LPDIHRYPVSGQFLPEQGWRSVPFRALRAATTAGQAAISHTRGQQEFAMAVEVDGQTPRDEPFMNEAARIFPDQTEVLKEDVLKESWETIAHLQTRTTSSPTLPTALLETASLDQTRDRQRKLMLRSRRR